MKTVIEMAREAGCALWEDGSVSPALERFAELVRADEREACAKVCETHAPTTIPAYVSYAAAIRARGSNT